MLVMGSVLLGAAALSAEPPSVMNAGGIPYKISNPPGSTKDWVGMPGNYSVDFNNNVKGKVEYFDVYGEVRTKYSQVYWTRNTPINLPDELVKRFAGKVMAITGYEIDQVTHSGPQTGTTTKGDVLGGFACYPDCSDTDKSVPSYNAYNHHYFGWLQGADSELYDLDEAVGVPNPTTTAFRDLPSASLHGYPTNIVFKENPGGEFRKSYHGYPSGYAQLLHSPTNWIVEPMQIDTHNRQFDINDDTVGLVPSFIPKAVQNNMTQKGGLSPLIECPCSTRITRKVVNTSGVVMTGTCPQAITSLSACVAAAEEMGAAVSTSVSNSTTSLPSGCVLRPSPTLPGTYDVVFNPSTTTKQTCEDDSHSHLQLAGPFNNTEIDTGVLAPSAEYNCTNEFPEQCTWDSPEQAEAACSQIDECRGFFCSTYPFNAGSTKLLCYGRTSTELHPPAGGAAYVSQSWVKKLSVSGPINGTVMNGGVLAPSPDYGCTNEFPNQCTWDSVEQATTECNKADECQGFMCSTFDYPGKKVPGKFLCYARSDTTTQPTSEDSQSYVKLNPGSKDMAGSGNLGDLVNISLSHDGVNANITLTGTDGVWFGVGFDATTMADLPYALIVSGNGTVEERKLANHGPGSALASSFTLLSNTVTGRQRKVVLTRPVAALTSDHYAIPTTPGSINVIVAEGNTPELAYHAKRTGAAFSLLPSKVSSCLCQPQSSTYLTYMNESTTEFHTTCVDEPRSDMLRHGDTTGRELPNAACNMQTYHGGLRCCKHTYFLTDLEQDSLIPNKTDTYFLKWRYYFQEYEPATATSPASHKSLYHYVFLIDDAVNDYEEDNANYGTASVGRITAHLNVQTMGLENAPAGADNVSFLVMTPHCHAPSCIRQEIWNADTNEILCNVSGEYSRPEYGSQTAVFNELDYIAIPPCIFGEQPGLQTPWTLPFDTNITAYKYLNNTYRHLGQMAQWTGLIHYPGDAF